MATSTAGAFRDINGGWRPCPLCAHHHIDSACDDGTKCMAACHRCNNYENEDPGEPCTGCAVGIFPHACTNRRGR